MRVLFVNTHFDPETGGGYFRRTMELARACKELGHEVTLLATDYRFGTAAKRETSAFTVHLLPTFSSRFFVPRLGRNHISRIVEASDVIHLMGFWSLINVLVAREARRQNVPFVLCPAGAIPAYGRSRLLKRLFRMIFGSTLIANAKIVTPITRRESEDLARDGIPTSKLKVMPNGVSPEFFEPLDPRPFRSKHRLGSDPYVLFVGRLNPIKGPDLLVEAFAISDAKKSGYRLVLAGPDEGMKSRLEVEAERLRVPLTFTGFLNLDEKRQAYSGCSILAVPSRSEAMSLVALEAAACARPVLLTDQCGFDEVASVGGGEVVKADPKSLATGLKRLIEASPANLDKMGLRLQKKVKDEFTWPKIAESMLREAGRAP